MTRWMTALAALLLLAAPAWGMNKKELAAKLAGKTGLSQAEAAEIVTIIFSAKTGIIATELDAGRKVTIPGFGTFGVSKRREFTGVALVGNKQNPDGVIPATHVLPRKLAERASIDGPKAASIVNEIFAAEPGRGIIATALAAGDTVEMPRLGFTAKLTEGKVEASLVGVYPSRH